MILILGCQFVISHSFCSVASIPLRDSRGDKYNYRLCTVRNNERYLSSKFTKKSRMVQTGLRKQESRFDSACFLNNSKNVKGTPGKLRVHTTSILEPQNSKPSELPFSQKMTKTASGEGSPGLLRFTFYFESHVHMPREAKSVRVPGTGVEGDQPT